MSQKRVVRGDVTKRVNARDENENNNTGFGVIRIQVASKSARAPLAGSDRYRYGPYQYSFYNLVREALGYIDVTRNQTDRLSKVFRYIVVRNPY